MSGASATTAPRTATGILWPSLVVLLCCAVAVVTALSPVAGGALAAVTGIAGATTAMMLGLRVPFPVWLVAALAGVAITARWPTAGFVVAAVMVIVVLAVRAPVYGFLGALLLFGYEGSIKMRLTVEDAPSPLALGAALIDIAFIVAVAGLVVHDRGRTLQRLWRRFGRAERLVALALAAWLCLAVLQIPLGDSISNGVEGYRLVHFYVPAVIGGVLLAARLSPDRLGFLLLLVIGGISAYAAFRGIVGPTENEREFAESRARGTYFGDHPRDTGSFTSPVALVSFLVPAGVFALVLGYLQSSRRLVAGLVFILTMVGVIASYVRTALVAMVAGAVLLAGLLIGGAGVPRRQKLLAVGLVGLVLAGGYGATLLAGDVDPMAEERAESLANPFSDESVTTRLKTWDRSLNRVVSEPLGTGVGTIGRATIERDRLATYTDSSYLKILQEQGFLGGLLFLFAVGGATVLCARRLIRAGPPAHPLGVAALVGFAAFLFLCLMGEYIEQPGKAFTWALLGIATWEAYGR